VDASIGGGCCRHHRRVKVHSAPFTGGSRAGGGALPCSAPRCSISSAFSGGRLLPGTGGWDPTDIWWWMGSNGCMAVDGIQAHKLMTASRQQVRAILVMCGSRTMSALATFRSINSPGPSHHSASSGPGKLLGSCLSPATSCRHAHWTPHQTTRAGRTRTGSTRTGSPFPTSGTGAWYYAGTVHPAPLCRGECELGQPNCLGEGVVLVRGKEQSHAKRA
jgi:hypothetical protein